MQEQEQEFLLRLLSKNYMNLDMWGKYMLHAIKGLVLGSKRTRFEQQKESFCKAKGLHFYPKSESREIQIKTCHIM